MEPLQGERPPGAVSNEPLETRPVLALDASGAARRTTRSSARALDKEGTEGPTRDVRRVMGQGSFLTVRDGGQRRHPRTRSCSDVINPPWDQRSKPHPPEWKQNDPSIPRQARYQGAKAADLIEEAFGSVPVERYVALMEALKTKASEEGYPLSGS